MRFHPLKFLFLSLLCNQLVAETARLPENFFFLDNNTLKESISTENKSPIFYVIVPEHTTHLKNDKVKLKQLQMFSQSVTVPKDFFQSGSPTKAIKPICLVFCWQERENIQTRKTAGNLLAQGLNSLRYRFKGSKVILLGHGHGGNVINNASKYVNLPIDIAIELGTPVFPTTPTEKYKNPEEFHPSKKIKRLFAFYTEQSFNFAHPTLHPEYEHYFIKTTHKALSNILLLLNNKHPLPGEMLNAPIGKRILTLCQKIKDSYQIHNHLIAHISTVKPNADMVVALYDTTTVSTGRKRTSQIAQERFLSKVRSEKFTKDWGRPLAKNLKASERTRTEYKELNLSSSENA